MTLIHPDNLQIRPWDKLKELGPNKTILPYHYLPQKEKTQKEMKEY